MLAAILTALLFVLPDSSGEGGHFRFEPIAPTDRSFVTLQVRQVWRDGCLPIDAQVTRSGSAVDVLWRLRPGGCTLATEPWNDDVPLGVLGAGVYTVTLRVDDRGTLRTLDALKLVVTEGAPALRIEPRLASTAGGSEILFPGVCAEATVIVDGVTVPSRVERCTLTATLPAHAAGPVNVRVITASRTFDVVNGVHYVDPAAAPDPSLYERVLLPVLYQGPGAFGSQWQTEVVMRNFSERPLRAPIPNTAAPQPPVPAGGAASPSAVFGNRPSGVLLFVPRGSDVGFTSHIRDVSRDATQWGTEMPVVRERDTRQSDLIALDNVPFDARYRLQLRIYGIDGVTTPVRVFVTPNALRQLDLVRGPCSLDVHCNSNEPAYASIDLGSAFPALSGKHTLFIQQQVEQPRRLWAFVTVTNNETQHVTVIRPQ